MVPTAAPYLLRPLAASELLEHVERAWPVEACGLVFADGSGEAVRVAPVENALGKGAAARRGFRMDPHALLAKLREAECRAERLVAIYHSHPEGDASFSEVDRREALDDEGAPLWPGVEYLVVAVNEGRAREARGFHWDGSAWSEARRLELPAERPTGRFPAR